jgi:uncharacterized protein (DUF2141 family)
MIKKNLFILILFLNNSYLYSQINLNVENIETLKGSIFLAVYNSDDSFLKTEKAILKTINPVLNNKLIIAIPNLPKGKYAIAIFHDIDNNQKLNTYFGIPAEPYGFSQNQNGGLLGPPKFRDTFFYFDGINKDLTISLVELL